MRVAPASTPGGGPGKGSGARSPEKLPKAVRNKSGTSCLAAFGILSFQVASGVMPPIPGSVHRYLRTASLKTAAQQPFASEVFGNEWDGFVEQWAPLIYSFVLQALGPYGREPLPTILPLEEAQHAAWATASFDPGSGQVRLSSSVAGNPGTILEKLTHEFTHGSLNDFPEGDPFYEEGFVDYSVWVMAHAPVWGEHREAMIAAAEYNIAQRRDRAMRLGTDYDRKRWAGGMYAMFAHGPFIVASLRTKKMEGTLAW